MLIIATNEKNHNKFEIRRSKLTVFGQPLSTRDNTTLQSFSQNLRTLILKWI